MTHDDLIQLVEAAHGAAEVTAPELDAMSVADSVAEAVAGDRIRAELHALYGAEAVAEAENIMSVSEVPFVGTHPLLP